MQVKTPYLHHHGRQGVHQRLARQEAQLQPSRLSQPVMIVSLPKIGASKIEELGVDKYEYQVSHGGGEEVGGYENPRLIF